MKSHTTSVAAKAMRFTPLAATFLILFPFVSSVQAQQETMLSPVVVTAARTSQSMAEVLSDATVITSEEIATSGHGSVVELLRGHRGMEFTRNGGPGTNTELYLRGTENKQNIVLIDGIRTGSSTSGGTSWSAIPLSQIERIEIVRGPLSGLYGSDAIGGVIQIFTKKGEGPPAPTASVGFGSYNTYKAEAGISGAALTDGKLSYAINIGHEKSDGYSARPLYNPDKDGYESDSASAQIGFAFAPGHKVNLSYLKSHVNSQYDSTSLTRDDRTIRNLQSYSLAFDNQILSNWKSRVQIGQSKDEYTDQAASVSRFDTTQSHLSWQNDFAIGKNDLLQFIFENHDEKVDSTRAELRRGRDTRSMAVAYQLQRGSHLGSATVRHDDSSQFGGQTTGSLGYGYRLTEALRASASVGTSFRAPSFNELYRTDYGFAGNRPEEGRNAEIGLLYAQGTTEFSAVYYRNRIENLIVNSDPCPIPGYTRGCAYNVEQALLKGISLGAETRTGKMLWRATLDLQDPTNETTGTRLQRRAKQHGLVAAEYLMGTGSVGAEVAFSSDRFNNAANTDRLPGYGLVNLYASHEFARNWTVFGRWNNVFDKEYELARDYNTAGSNVFVGVRYGLR